jgi:hypothetical protein
MLHTAKQIQKATWHTVKENPRMFSFKIVKEFIFIRPEEEGNTRSSPEGCVAERPKNTTTTVAAWCRGCS